MPTAEEFPSCNYWPFSHDEKNKNVKCQRRAADEKWISDSGGVLLCVMVCSVS